jgi:hypothetical protein
MRLLRWCFYLPDRAEAWTYRKTAEWFIRRGVPRSAFKDMDRR